MNDELKKDVVNFLYALMAYIIVKDIIPKLKPELEIKDDNE